MPNRRRSSRSPSNGKEKYSPHRGDRRRTNQWSISSGSQTPYSHHQSDWERHSSHSSRPRKSNDWHYTRTPSSISFKDQRRSRSRLSTSTPPELHHQHHRVPPIEDKKTGRSPYENFLPPRRQDSSLSNQQPRYGPKHLNSPVGRDSKTQPEATTTKQHIAKGPCPSNATDLAQSVSKRAFSRPSMDWNNFHYQHQSQKESFRNSSSSPKYEGTPSSQDKGWDQNGQWWTDYSEHNQGSNNPVTLTARRQVPSRNFADSSEPASSHQVPASSYSFAGGYSPSSKNQCKAHTTNSLDADFYHACFTNFFYCYKKFSLFYNGSTPQQLGLQWKMMVTLTMALGDLSCLRIISAEDISTNLETIAGPIFQCHNLISHSLESDKIELVLETARAWSHAHITWDLLYCVPRAVQYPSAQINIENPLNPNIEDSSSTNLPPFSPPKSFTPFAVSSEPLLSKAINSLLSINGFSTLQISPIAVTKLVLELVGYNPMAPGMEFLLHTFVDKILRRIHYLKTVSRKWLEHRQSKEFTIGLADSEDGGKWLCASQFREDPALSFSVADRIQPIRIPTLPLALISRNLVLSLPALTEEIRRTKILSWIKAAISFDNTAIKSCKTFNATFVLPKKPPAAKQIAAPPKGTFQSQITPVPTVEARPSSKTIPLPPGLRPSIITNQPGEFSTDEKGNQIFTNSKGIKWIRSFCRSRRNLATGKPGNLRWKRMKISQDSTSSPQADNQDTCASTNQSPKRTSDNASELMDISSTNPSPPTKSTPEVNATAKESLSEVTSTPLADSIVDASNPTPPSAAARVEDDDAKSVRHDVSVSDPTGAGDVGPSNVSPTPPPNTKTLSDYDKAIAELCPTSPAVASITPESSDSDYPSLNMDSPYVLP